MGSENLDETDRRILSLISRNSNIRYSELADEVGVSRNTAYRRVKKLKEWGIINKDFITNTDVDILEFERIGVSTLMVAMKFDIESFEEASEFLKEREEVKLIFETFGEYDIIAVLFGEEGKERKMVARLRENLKNEKIGLEDFRVFSTSLKKADFTLPFNFEEGEL
ncbi:hypothetical protein AKJ64_00720 [candidate division MSBL1 archaeon SCGC-AAA259E17]|uniref:HTH asnC-type domain-containing protein n=1 Tax=candidate division MSBL1 archaeon SCGC-AAA259E17 TaxID=1698263 RepID=A0A133UGY8_9EURY|nr:hypothetical protein AKJ64_00720 [candidate division MSBL1 archaeon SCGC-AAA259E17]